MNKSQLCILFVSAILIISNVQAKDEAVTSPQAGARTYAQNYKDMVMAECVATAYKNEPAATKDAGSSVSALRDWSYYDLEQSPDAVKELIERYLARDYHNLLAESEVKGVRFDFLKCLDLYHSEDLEALTKNLVINPKRSYRQDNSRATK